MSTHYFKNASDPSAPNAATTTTSSTIRKLLLVCGILAAVLWMGADIIAAMLYPGYSYTAQAISELSAIGAPTKPFLTATGVIYIVLEFAFAVGVWMAAGGKRSLRITAGLLFAFWVVGLVSSFFPMQQRADLAESGRTLTGTMHLILMGAAPMLLIPLMMGFGATADGKWFRFYSYASILLIIMCGVWTAMAVPQVEANLPTPWLGVRERMLVYGYMVWMMVLAIVLLRAQATAPQESRPPA